MSVASCDPTIGNVDHGRNWPVWVTLWVTFLLYGAIAAPLPGVNEPHYLCKSKHYWQPEWCANDFFLASPNAHTVFYATIGGLTQFVSFDQAAWAGRIVTSLLLAIGWNHGLSRLFFNQWATVWAAWLYLALAACGNFSGEWLVGGVEGKVLCYGFLLLALGEVLRQRLPINGRGGLYSDETQQDLEQEKTPHPASPRKAGASGRTNTFSHGFLAAASAGLAISFHPVVGIWGVLAYLLSDVVHRLREFLHDQRASTRLLAAGETTPAKSYSDETRQESEQEKIPHPASPRKAGARGKSSAIVFGYLVCCLIFVALALPGLVPVYRLLTETASKETRFAAAYLQVYFRLAHHLDPMLFSVRSYAGYALMLVVWLCGFQWGGRTKAKGQFDQIVLWAVVFALAGILIGWGPRPAKLMPFFAERMQLLKFYPFRLADVLLPIALAVSLISVLERSLFDGGTNASSAWTWRSEWLILLLFVAGLCRVHSTVESNRYSREDRVDWLDVCSWIDQNLPPDAVVQSPTNGWAFKWFARRAEYVSFKDCPQDAAGIVEWNRRLNFLQKWFEQNYADEFYSADELRELRRLTGLSHILTDRLGPLALEPVYRNETFQVYDLRTLDSPESSSKL